MIYLLYSLLFLFVGLVLVDRNEIRTGYYYILYFGVVLFWGLSYIHAMDTSVYMAKFYDEIQPIGGHISRKLEIGYTLSAMLAKTIIPHYWFYQFVIFGIEVWLIMKGLRKFYEGQDLMFVLPLLFFVYPSNLAAFRQGMAISIFIFALHYIDEESTKKSLLYFALILVASLCHQSALILLFIYVARYIIYHPVIDYVVFAILAVVDIIWSTGLSLTTQLDFLLPFLYDDYLDMGEKFAQYIEDVDWGSTYGFAKLVEINVTVILYTLFCKEDKGWELFLFNIIIYAVIGLAFGGMLAHRLNYYWTLIYYTCFIKAFVSLFSRDGQQIIAYILIGSYMVWFYLLKGGMINSDYSFLFLMD